MAQELKQSLRMLLLPMRAGIEADCAKVMLRQFREHGVKRSDYRDWAGLQLGDWKDAGEASKVFKAVVRLILEADKAPDAQALAVKYFNVHESLVSAHLMSHDEARACLSHAFVIADLARSAVLSAAQIAKLMAERDKRVPFSRDAVAQVLGGMGLLPEIENGKFRRQFAQDNNQELATFADADIPTSIEIVELAASSLGFPGTISGSLNRLTPAEQLGRFTPYLQILHYQCMTAEFFDHAVTDLYEFSPRGKNALWLFDQYPDSMASAGNPFLNNAKSVERVDEAWVRSKKIKERVGASALLQVLVGLEAMGFAARRELAKVLRLWILRILRLSQPSAIKLPVSLTDDQYSQILKRVKLGNSGTYGILEQRLVDAIASTRFDEAKGWRFRGLGDSINATNLSQRKIGDCDFQNAAQFRIDAFEAHGGELSPVYVEEHIRTLKKVMGLRIEELRGISEPAKWKASVTFVAHETTVGRIDPIEIEGVTFEMKVVSFADFLTVPVANVSAAFHKWLLQPLHQKRTPAEVRKKFLAMVGL